MHQAVHEAVNTAFNSVSSLKQTYSPGCFFVTYRFQSFLCLKDFTISSPSPIISNVLPLTSHAIENAQMAIQKG